MIAPDSNTAKSPAAWCDNSWDPCVGVQFHILRRPLLTLHDVHRMERIRDPKLFQGARRLPAICGGPGVQIDGRRAHGFFYSLLRLRWLVGTLCAHRIDRQTM